MTKSGEEEQRALRARDAGDYQESARLFEPLAERGSPTALLNLGWLHDSGHLGPRDTEKAISLYEKAVEADSAEAKDYLQRALIQKEEQLAWRLMESGDYAASARLLEALVERDSEWALLNLGWLHDSGHLGRRDTEKAISLYEKAVEAGSAVAKDYLRYLEENRAWSVLETGAYEKSARLFEPLAERGSVTALLNLGWMYNNGRLGPRDIEKAISFYERAARTGSASAKHYLGNALRRKGELQRARALFIEGAEQGNTPCMTMAGKMMVRGQGGVKDLQAGTAWLERAAGTGHLYARRELLRLEIEKSRSPFGKLRLWGKVVWGAFAIIPLVTRDPYSDNLR
jgi:TPR repeat protein